MKMDVAFHYFGISSQFQHDIGEIGGIKLIFKIMIALLIMVMVLFHN